MIDNAKRDAAITTIDNLSKIKANFDAYLKIINLFDDNEKQLINTLPSRYGFKRLQFSEFQDYEYMYNNRNCLKLDIMHNVILHYKRENNLNIVIPNTENCFYNIWIIDAIKAIIISKKAYEKGFNVSKIKKNKEKKSWELKKQQLQTLLQSCETDCLKHLQD